MEKKKMALDAYADAMSAISALLDELKAEAEDHMGVAPEAGNWGHVGSAQHLLSLLNDAATYAGIR